MAVLESHVDTQSEEYRENTAYFEGLVQELRERTRLVEQGGGDDAVAKHRKRKKLLARERIALLCDPQTPFLELSALAAWDMYEGEAPSAGIVTGIGVVEARSACWLPTMPPSRAARIIR